MFLRKKLRKPMEKTNVFSAKGLDNSMTTRVFVLKACNNACNSKACRSKACKGNDCNSKACKIKACKKQSLQKQRLQNQRLQKQSFPQQQSSQNTVWGSRSGVICAKEIVFLRLFKVFALGSQHRNPRHTFH